jgi:hypothetical protein
MITPQRTFGILLGMIIAYFLFYNCMKTPVFVNL